MPTRQFVLVDAHEREGGAPPWGCTVGLLAVNFDRPHAYLAAQGEQSHAGARFHGPTPGRSGHDGPSAREREHAVDRQPKEVIRWTIRDIPRDYDKRGPQLIEALSAHRRNRKRRMPAHSAARQPLGHLRSDHA